MAIYEIILGNADYGVIVHSLHLACLTGVIVGLEVHNRNLLPNSTSLTKVEDTPEASWEALEDGE